MEPNTIGGNGACASRTSGEGGTWAPCVGGEADWRWLVVDLGAGRPIDGCVHVGGGWMTVDLASNFRKTKRQVKIKIKRGKR